MATKEIGEYSSVGHRENDSKRIYPCRRRTLPSKNHRTSRMEDSNARLAAREACRTSFHSQSFSGGADEGQRAPSRPKSPCVRQAGGNRDAGRTSTDRPAGRNRKRNRSGSENRAQTRQGRIRSGDLRMQPPNRKTTRNVVSTATDTESVSCSGFSSPCGSVWEHRSASAPQGGKNPERHHGISSRGTTSACRMALRTFHHGPKTSNPTTLRSHGMSHRRRHTIRQTSKAGVSRLSEGLAARTHAPCLLPVHPEHRTYSSSATRGTFAGEISTSLAAVASGGRGFGVRCVTDNEHPYPTQDVQHPFLNVSVMPKQIHSWCFLENCSTRGSTEPPLHALADKTTPHTNRKLGGVASLQLETER